MTTLTIRNVDRHLKERLRIVPHSMGSPWKPSFVKFYATLLRRQRRRSRTSRKRSAAASFLLVASSWNYPHARRSERRCRSNHNRPRYNVLSELMRPEPPPAVFAWVAAQPRESLYTTSLSRAKVLYGVAALPKGCRKEALAAAAGLMFQEGLADRILPFDGNGATQYAKLVVARREACAPIDAFNALIARRWRPAPESRRAMWAASPDLV